MAVSLFRPTIKRRNMNSVLTCMVSDRIGAGLKNRELASVLSAYTGTAGGFCFGSYSAAIQYALDSLGLRPKDSVIISALAPALYLKLLRARALIPLPADVDPDSGELKPSAIENLLAVNPKAIILYYNLGYIPDVETITRFGIPVMEDLSQVLGGRIGDKRCGSFGRISVLSLAPEGIITTAGGGIVLSRDKKILRALQADLEGYMPSTLLSDLNAALGLSQMKEIERYLAGRKEIAHIFAQSLLKSRHQTLVQNGEIENIPIAFPVIVKDGMKQVRHYAMKKNIETKSAFAGTIIARAKSLPGSIPGDEAHVWRQSCPNAQKLLSRCLLFPIYPSLGKKNVQLISKVLSTLP